MAEISVIDGHEESSDCIPTVIDERPFASGTKVMSDVGNHDNITVDEKDGLHSGDSVNQDLDLSADEGSASKVDTGSPNEVRLQFSVYTAHNGYDWSNIPEGADRDGLDYYYQKAVAFKPDFMVSGDVVKGVFAQNDCIAAFRIQIVKHWDDFGRDAEYCAFVFFSYEQAKRVDFEALLEMPEFRNPSHEPPTVISYQGLPSKDIDSAQSISDIKGLFRGATLKSFDFAKIGALISAHGGKCERWLFSKVESSFENTVSVSTGKWSEDPFPPPPPPPPPPTPVPQSSVECVPAVVRQNEVDYRPSKGAEIVHAENVSAKVADSRRAVSWDCTSEQRGMPTAVRPHERRGQCNEVRELTPTEKKQFAQVAWASSNGANKNGSSGGWRWMILGVMVGIAIGLVIALLIECFALSGVRSDVRQDPRGEIRSVSNSDDESDSKSMPNASSLNEGRQSKKEDKR